MKIKINNNKYTAYKSVLFGLSTSLLSASIATSAQAGELVFGNLKSGLGPGIEWQEGDTRLNVKGAMGLGSVWRTENPSNRLTSPENGMNLFNDGNLNYKRGDATSTSIDGYLQADLSHRNVGVLLSAKGWYDHALKHNGVDHGNVPNGYQSGKKLSDDGFVPLARFSNLVLNDAYIYGNFKVADRDLLVRLGDQAIPWVTPTTIAGGIQVVNAFDFAAMRRASSITEARTVPVPTLYAKLSLTDNLTIDAYNQFKFRPNVFAGCGTFLSTSDYAQPGCNRFTLNGSVLSAIYGQSIHTSDEQSLTNPLDYVVRGPDRRPSNNQYGASLQYLMDDVGIFGLYYASYTGKGSITQVVRTAPGVVTGMPQDPKIAAYYQRAFPTEIRMYGLNFKTRLPDGTGIYAEYTYRPNQPITWNGADFISGLLSGKGPLGDLASTPTGYLARGYDRFRVSQFNLGANRPLGTQLGGEMKVSAEAGLKYIHNLPSKNERRYGRVGFGVAPYDNKPCKGPKEQCSSDGFITSVAWGTRFKIENQYKNVLPGLDLTPSLALGYDVKGQAYDGIFSEGRHAQVLGLQGVYKDSYTFNMSYLNTGGGDYNILADRSMFEASIGLRF